MDGPHSSYSCLEIHICWKVEREARMEPPIQTEYFLSGGAMILILMVEGARAVIHICWKVEREDKMEPPIQTEYFLSGGAMILILMVDGARAVISFCIRSAIPG